MSIHRLAGLAGSTTLDRELDERGRGVEGGCSGRRRRLGRRRPDLERDGREDTCARPPARVGSRRRRGVVFARETGFLLEHQGRRPQHRRHRHRRRRPRPGHVADAEVIVDPEARLAHVGPGCRLRDVDRATQEHGLATVLGFISEVGVAGLTLGGGLGYLARRFGWAVDNLEEVEIVTADGGIRTAHRDENAELFWALRGGGGELRRRHPVHVPPARGRTRGARRPDRLAVRTGRRDHRRATAMTAEAPRELSCVADPAPRSAGAVRPRRVARR